jgi:hypothetical protein
MNKTILDYLRENDYEASKGIEKEHKNEIWISLLIKFLCSSQRKITNIMCKYHAYFDYSNLH